jgi:hypothetical protein
MLFNNKMNYFYSSLFTKHWDYQKNLFLAQKQVFSGIYFKREAKPLFLFFTFLPDEFSDWTRRSWVFQINTRPFCFDSHRQKGIMKITFGLR